MPDFWIHALAILALPIALILWALLQTWIRRQEPTLRGVEKGGGCCGGSKAKGTCTKTGPQTCKR